MKLGYVKAYNMYAIFLNSLISRIMKKIAIIKHNNKEVARFEVVTGGEILKWFHSHSSFSMSWLMRYENYSYEIIDVE